MNLPLNLKWEQAQTRWANILNPVVSSVIQNGVLLTSIQLAIGNNTINHTLGRIPQGWVVVDLMPYSEIYRNGTLNSSTLILNSSAATTVNLWVF